MAHRVIFVLLICMGMLNAMEHPRALVMRRDSSSVHGLKVSNKKLDPECDCLDIMRRSEYLLRQHQVIDAGNPLRRKDTVHCCGECCEITNDCVGSTIVLCAPQACLCAALSIALRTVGQAWSSCEPHWQCIVLASLGGTVCISSCVSMRNKALTEQKES